MFKAQLPLARYRVMGYFGFLKNTEKRSVWLKSNSSGSFKVNILFGLSNIREDLFPKNRSAAGYQFQGYTFDELKKILLANGIYSIGVYFHLLSRSIRLILLAEE